MRRFLVAVYLTAALLSSPTLSFTQPTSAPQTERQRNPEVKVWVNTHSGVYHCPGTRWYGVTKSGTYMTQTEAQQHGYRPAYGKVCQSEASATSPATPSQQEKTAPTQTQRKRHPGARLTKRNSLGIGIEFFTTTRPPNHLCSAESLFQSRGGFVSSRA
jgi:hypothetical protein